MRNWDKVREQLSRYYEGETSLEEEKELKDTLQQEGLPEDLRTEAQLLGWHLQEQQLVAPFTEKELWNKLPAAPKSTATPLWQHAWKVAAAVALLVLGFAGGKVSTSTEELPGTPLSNDISAVRQELAELKSLLQEGATTGQRLQAVTVAAEGPKADAELLMALIHTMHFDDNVNVRQAAVAALLNYRQHPQVRQALIHSLSIQTDPNVQLMLIQGLTGMQEKEAVPHMQELLKEKELQQEVRQQLEESISILI